MDKWKAHLIRTATTMQSQHPTRTETFRRERNAVLERPSSTRARRRRTATTAATDATAAEAAAIQQSLSRTQKLLQSELTRVSAVQNAIDDDEKLLRQTMHAHQTLNVKAVKKALTELERAKQQENRVLAAAILFFWSAVLYVLWCRILIRIPFLEQILGILPRLTEYAIRFVASLARQSD